MFLVVNFVSLFVFLGTRHAHRGRYDRADASAHWKSDMD